MKKRVSAGNLALFLCLMATCSWTLWGVIEMFHEGWYAPFEWLFFLLPAGVCMALTLIALTWPRLGACLLIGAGTGFYAWMLWNAAERFELSVPIVLSWLPVSGLLALVGVLFLLEARRRRQIPGAPDPRWWRRNLHYLLAIGLPLLFGLGLAVGPTIRVANRVDDGAYGARLIQGNGIALTWAPSGPGWRDSVTWNQIALYGLPSVGLGQVIRARGAMQQRQQRGLCQCRRYATVQCLPLPEPRWLALGSNRAGLLGYAHHRPGSALTGAAW